jgi:FolB domain-containing protein
VPNESHPFPDKIHIEQLDVFTRIGVPEEERASPQKLVVSISIWPYQQPGDLVDHIERAVDYSAVAEETKNFVRGQSVRLIETLADKLASHLLKNFPIQKLTIELRKFALQDAKYVSVTVSRTACIG